VPDELPEHPSCDPDGKHCLGCCPGWTSCPQRMCQPPRPNGLDSAWRGQGRHRPWDTGGPGPLRPLQRVAVTGEDAPVRVVYQGPSIGGPNR